MASQVFNVFKDECWGLVLLYYLGDREEEVPLLFVIKAVQSAQAVLL